jgi:hypothetical protein
MSRYYCAGFSSGAAFGSVIIDCWQPERRIAEQMAATI